MMHAHKDLSDFRKETNMKTTVRRKKRITPDVIATLQRKEGAKQQVQLIDPKTAYAKDDTEKFVQTDTSPLEPKVCFGYGEASDKRGRRRRTVTIRVSTVVLLQDEGVDQPSTHQRGQECCAQ